MSQRPQPRLRWLAPAAALALTCAPLFAHEDDPKLLDRQPPFPGHGLRTALPAPGTRLGSSKALSFPASGVTLLSWLSLGDFNSGATGGNDCWGYTSPSGREYALMGLTSGTAFVEITNPNNPVIVANIAGPTSTWRDIKVFGTRVYSVSEGGSGIQVFNVANIDAGQVTLLGTVTTGGDLATHNVAIDTASGFLYRCGGGSNGLRIYDLNANPTAPPFVGSWATKYVHDVQVITYTSGPQAGKQIAYCCSGFNGGFTNTGLSVVDVTNKANPVVLKEVFWSGAQYSHQVWLSPDLKYAYLNDELDEDGVLPTTTYVIDVQSPANAFLVGSFTNGNTAIGHNLYTEGTQIFEANYRSGLRVFSTASSQTAPTEVAYFDTYPDDDSDQFNGLWSNYPYFPSGVVIGSDIEKGLFVWWVGTPLLDIQPVSGPLALLNPNGQSFDVTITESLAGTLQGGTAQLNFDAGAGLVSVPLTNIGGNTWTGQFPATACGSSVSYFVSAESTNGITWSWPEGGPSNPASVLSAFSQTIVAADSFETNLGWTGGAAGDNATTGIWTRVDPVGTGAQPEDDHTTGSGIRCWVTGQGVVGGGLGDADVDGGTTTLVSAVYNLTGMNEPIVSYWRWYSNNQNGVVDDTFVVQVSNGGAWVNVETVGPTGLESSGGWFQHAFKVADFVVPNATVQVRFRASDLGSGSIVEAAIDDFEITDIDCSATTPTIYCTAKLNSEGCFASIGFSGTPSLSNATPFHVTATDVVTKKTGILFYAYAAGNQPFMGGTLCTNGIQRRTAGQNSGGTAACSGVYDFDFSAYAAAGGDPNLGVGTQVNAQYWFRDPTASFSSGLSNAIEFVMQP